MILFCLCFRFVFVVFFASRRWPGYVNESVNVNVNSVKGDGEDRVSEWVGR